MKIKIPTYFRNSIGYLIIGFLPLSVNFILAPLFTQIFVPADYALLGIAGIFQNIFVVVIGLGLTAAVSRFYFRYLGNQLLKHTLFSTTLLLITGIFLLFFFLLLFVGDPLVDMTIENDQFTYSRYGIWVYVNCFFTVVNMIILSFYRNEENLKSFALVSLSFFAFTIAGNLIGIFTLDLGVFGSISGRAVGGGIATIPFLISFLIKGKMVIRKRLLKPLFRFGLPLVPYGFLMMFYESLDKLLIDRYFTADDLGIYTLSYQIAGVVSVFIFSLFNAISPQLNAFLSESKINNVKIRSHTNIFLLVAMLIITGFIASINFLIEWIIDPQYFEAARYIPVLIVSYAGRIFYLIFSLILLFHHRTNSFNLITILSIGMGLLVFYMTQSSLGILSVYFSVLSIKVFQALFCFFYLRLSRHYVREQLNSVWVSTTAMLLMSVPLITSQMAEEPLDGRWLNVIPLALLSLLVLFRWNSIRSVKLFV